MEARVRRGRGLPGPGLRVPGRAEPGAQEDELRGDTAYVRSVAAAATEADGGAPDVVVLPDGNVVPSSAGTLLVAFGRREPLFPEDDPAWTADVWAGVLDGAGRVATWRAEQSAPMPGPFDAAGRTGGYWFTLGFGSGVGGGRGHTLQSIGFAFSHRTGMVSLC